MRRVVVVMLAVPLLLIAASQALLVPHPQVIVDLGAGFIVAAAAVALSDGLTRPAVAARWLVVAAVVTVAAFVVAATTPIEWALATAWSLAMLTGVLVARSQQRWMLVVAVVTSLACLLSPLTMPDRSGALLVPVVGCVLLPAIAAGLLWRSQQRATALARQAARDRERRAMAEELHDVVAHEITGIIVLAQAVQPALTQPAQAAALQRIETAASTALEQIRSLVSTLRTPQPDDPAPLPVTLTALEETVTTFAHSVPARVEFRGEGLDRPVDAAVARATERILIEALTNVRRHALTADLIEVEVTCQAEGVRLRVVDDGAGGGVGQGNGSGLLAMASRAELIGGTATAGRGRDGRWQVSAHLPNRPADQRESTVERRGGE